MPLRLTRSPTPAASLTSPDLAEFASITSSMTTTARAGFVWRFRGHMVLKAVRGNPRLPVAPRRSLRRIYRVKYAADK
jgi:hypothetical protein